LPSFVLCPALLFALGARSFRRTGARLARHLARLDLRQRVGLLEGATLAFGIIAILLVWFPTLTPQNASYDSRWYHPPIAEHYVAQGRIGPFTEGWVLSPFRPRTTIASRPKWT
jgi:hypothetical protein